MNRRPLPRSIQAEWDNKDKKAKWEQDVEVPLPEDVVLKIGSDGILIAVPNTEEQLFLSNHLLDLDEKNGQYTLHINPSVSYHLAPDKINPDLRLSDQQSKRSIRGEDLLRSMELKNGVQPEVVELGSEVIRSFTEKGLTITLPEDGIDKIFIPRDYVAYDPLSGRIQVKLYQRWNYSFRANQGWQSVTGAVLGQYLSHASMGPREQVRRRIRAMERRSARANLHQMNDVLWTLKNEGIEKADDFSVVLRELRGISSGIDGQIKAAEHKKAQYQQVIKWLVTAQEFASLDGARSGLMAWNRKRFEAEHKSELAALDHARDMLKKCGVEETVDPEKASSLITRQEERIADLIAAKKQVDQRIVKLRLAEQEIQRLNERREQDRGKEGQVL